MFSEKPAKGQLLWEHIIDTERSYSFDSVSETPVSRRKRFVAVRNAVRTEAKVEGQSVAPVHYIASQYLADSSLSLEASMYNTPLGNRASVFSPAQVGRQRSRVSRESLEVTYSNFPP